MSSVHRYIVDRESQLVRNLQDMVRIGTVNPPGLDYRAMVATSLGPLSRAWYAQQGPSRSRR